MKENNRIYYIDWLRIIIVALLIPHHIAITFSHIGDAYIYLPIKDNSLYFFIQSTFLNLWFMKMLFFISGISTFYALRKRTNKEYFIERCKKLLLPFAFAIVFVCPAMGYFKAITLHNFQGSLVAFYPIFFKNIVTYLGWAHFWFLVYLFVFSMFFLTIRMSIKNLDALTDKLGDFLSRGKNIIIPMTLFVLLEIVFRPFYPGFQTLINDWANFTVYLSFFLLGYVIANNYNCINSIVNNMRLLTIVGTTTTGLFIFLKYAHNNIHPFIHYYNDKTYTYQLCLSFIQGVAEYSLVFVFFGFTKLNLNRDNPLYRYLSKTSFSLYVFHFLLVNFTMYYIIELSWHHFTIYLLSICIVYGLFIILYELFIKQISPLRYILGINNDKGAVKNGKILK